jgi:hypothetical protein
MVQTPIKPLTLDLFLAIPETIVSRSLIADMAPRWENSHKFQYCLRFKNLDQYPDHLFFVKIGSQNTNLGETPPLLIVLNDCIPITGYRPVVTIAAISKQQVKQTDLFNFKVNQPSMIPLDQSRRLIRQDSVILRNPNLQKNLIISKSKISAPTSLPVVYENSTVEDSIEIKSVTENTLEFSIVSRSPQFSNLIIFPLIGLGLLGLAIWKRDKWMGRKK